LARSDADDVEGNTDRAEYIAENIPGARLWRPQGVRHNVHLERREEWIARVLDFLGKTAEDDI
jgi:pimeloyl-ACP methyl ester carboxylesterase